MKVLLDCRMAGWSGVGRYSSGLVRAMARMPDVQVVQMVAAGSTAPAPEAEAVPASGHPFSLPGAMEFGRVARAVRPDVTHALHFPTPVPVLHPLVVTMQDLTPLVVEGVMPSAVRRAAYRMWIARAVRVADRIIAPSEHSANDVLRFFPRAEGRTRAVLLAADDFTAGPVGELPAWLEGSQYLLTMGNTKPHKDLPTVLRAFAALDDPDVMLVLAGNDPGEYAASIVDNHPAAARVRFTGPIDDDTLRALYARAAALVFPSRYEGFGLPPLEAMSFGTPVVTSTASSLPEVVGDAALLVEPGDVAGVRGAIDAVLHDPMLAATLADSGRARASAFTWERTATETVGIYRDLLGG